MMNTFSPNAAVTQKEVRSFSNLLMSAIFATSFFVMFEPAPFDVLFSAFTAASLVFSGARVSRTSLIAFFLVAAFTASRTFTLLMSSDLDSSLRFFGITTYLSVTAWMFSVLVAQRGVALIDAAFRGLYVGAFITGVAVFLSLLHVGPLHDLVLAYGGTRAKGFFKDPNVMAPALIPVVLFSLMRLLERFSKIHFIIFLTSCFLVFVSFSRGAAATLVGAAIIFMFLLARNDGRRAINKFLLHLFLGSIALTVLGLTAYTYDSQSILGGGDRSTSYDEDRFYVHGKLLEEIYSTPFGIGPGETNNFIRSNFTTDGSNAAHETYLRVAIENGWIGLACYLMLVSYTLYLAVKSYFAGGDIAKYSAVFLAAYVATLVSALTVDTLHWRHQWWIMAFIWGIAAYRRTKLCARVELT